MPVFAYKALNAAATHVAGTVAADTAATARDMLRRQGLRLLEVRPVRFQRPRLRLPKVRHGRRLDAVGEFARQLSLLLRTGVSLVEALSVLIEQQKGPLEPVLRQVRERVEAGESLSAALELHAGWFDNVFCRAVEVGQEAGTLDRALSELAIFLREREDLRGKLLTALIYPMILLLLGTGVVIFLMTYVIPQLLTILEASNRDLPLATVILKRASDTLILHWEKWLIGAALIIATGTALRRWRRGAMLWHRMLLRIPLLATLLRKNMMAHFAQAMTLLLRSGVPFLAALRLVTPGVRNLPFRGELEALAGAVERGSDIAPSLKTSQVFPPVVTHILHVGQATGELTEMLEELQQTYREEVRLAIGKFTAALEPLLIVVMSAVIGFIVLATMLPILETTRVLN